MLDYTGIPCPICRRGFRRDEARPVICPDCGAPYHRACFAERGKCVFEAEHGGGFMWGNEDNIAPPKHEFITEVRFPTPKKDFGSENIPEKLLGDLQDTLEKISDVFDREKVKSDAEEHLIFGVSEKEIAHFQGMATPMRLLKYRRIAAGRRISLNILAGVFSPYYMFYSRMRVAGIAVSLMFFFLSLPLMLHSAASPSLMFSVEGLPRTVVIFGYISFGLRILLGLYFDYFYLRWTAFRITMIRNRFIYAAFPDVTPGQSFKLSDLGDDYYRVLQDSGKPSLRFMVLDGVAMYILQEILLYIFLFNR